MDVLAGGEESSVVIVSGNGTHGLLVHEQLAMASAARRDVRQQISEWIRNS